MLRLAAALVALVLAAGAGAMVVWLRLHVVPPDCEDPATLALVRQSLTGRFKLPASLTIGFIHTEAGGYIGFRFVCEASIGGIDREALPPDTTVPGIVHYTSQLTDSGKRHQVNVSIEPRIVWERVQ